MNIFVLSFCVFWDSVVVLSFLAKLSQAKSLRYCKVFKCFNLLAPSASNNNPDFDPLRVRAVSYSK